VRFFSIAMASSRQLVRDGRPYPPASLEQLVVGKQTSAALPALKARGLRLVVVTNQLDVGRGTPSRAPDESLRDALAARLPLALRRRSSCSAPAVRDCPFATACTKRC
jgi:hypothetical protein